MARHGKPLARRDPRKKPTRGAARDAKTTRPRDTKHSSPARGTRQGDARRQGDSQARGPGRHGKPHGAPKAPHGEPQRGRGNDGQSAPQPAAARQVPAATLERALGEQRALRVGEWLWTTRPGSERDLIEELLYRGPEFAPRRLAPALAASARAPLPKDARLEVTFARQAFQVSKLAQGDTPDALADQIASALPERLQGCERYALHVFVPDSDSSNPLTARAQSLQAAIEKRADALALNALRVDDAELRRHAATLVQVCLLAPDLAAMGSIHSGQALSLWPGGRARMRLSGDFPSRAARKLAEAFAWLGMSPSSGELCVDLGAAPGGWSWLLLEQRARVIAVDPARMDAKLMQNSRLRHVQGSAFDYMPDEPVDWLLCDMVWRPPEVAGMLGRWGKRRMTRMLVANFKLAMKRKVEMVESLRAQLQDNGYSNLRTRQLYHDRDEITLTALVRG